MELWAVYWSFHQKKHKIVFNCGIKRVTAQIRKHSSMLLPRTSFVKFRKWAGNKALLVYIMLCDYLCYCIRAGWAKMSFLEFLDFRSLYSELASTSIHCFQDRLQVRLQLIGSRVTSEMFVLSRRRQRPVPVCTCCWWEDLKDGELWKHHSDVTFPRDEDHVLHADEATSMEGHLSGAD